jgi:hypothetical protein
MESTLSPGRGVDPARFQKSVKVFLTIHNPPTQPTISRASAQESPISQGLGAIEAQVLGCLNIISIHVGPPGNKKEK